MESIKFRFILAFLFVVLLVTGRHASVSSEDYWKSVLPNTPLPPNILIAETVKDVLLQTSSTEWMENSGTDQSFEEYNSGYDGWKDDQARMPESGYYINIGTGKGVVIHAHVAIFFVEKDLYPGKRMNLHFPKCTNVAKFLPRQVADSIPFSSDKWLAILNKLSVDPSPTAARAMKKTIKGCERIAMKGEVKFCATSLESMVDFSTFILGQHVEAIWTKADKGADQVKEYKIVGVRRMPSGTGLIACHKMPYPYGVFYCHKISNTVAYSVSLVATDGSKLEAVAACHRDTTAWNPKHLAFKLLKVKPGGPPICHFLPEGHIMWLNVKN